MSGTERKGEVKREIGIVGNRLSAVFFIFTGFLLPAFLHSSHSFHGETVAIVKNLCYNYEDIFV